MSTESTSCAQNRHLSDFPCAGPCLGRYMMAIPRSEFLRVELCKATATQPHSKPNLGHLRAPSAIKWSEASSLPPHPFLFFD